MISYKLGVVESIIKEEEKKDIILVNIDNDLYKAINYKDITGSIQTSDIVVLNTTAVQLDLGTGGFHFVMFNYSNKTLNLEGPGHIMKLRYTPYQIKCLVAEEEESPYYSIYKDFKSLDKHICIVATLHSMIAPIIAIIKHLNSHLRINYIMTDGGALPIGLSDTVVDLKNKKLLDSTITMGHAFGGDLECTNIYTSLIAAKEILKGDITIISMGPGIVGTGTKYGFTGIEQGYILDAINNIGGFPIAVPRISFKDNRSRHYGISHHTLTILSEITNTRINTIFPILDDKKMKYIMKQIEEFDIVNKHNILFQDGSDVFEAMNEYDLHITTMGRTTKDDKDFFIALGACGNYVVNKSKEDKYDF